MLSVVNRSTGLQKDDWRQGVLGTITWPEVLDRRPKLLDSFQCIYLTHKIKAFIFRNVLVHMYGKECTHRSLNNEEPTK